MLRLFFLLAAGIAAAAQPGVRAQLMGGTLPEVKAKTAASLDLTRPDAMVLRCGGVELRINYSSVNTLEYGQNVSRRYAAAILVSPLLLLSKTRKHFLTVGYVDSEGRQQALVFRVNKGDIRVLLGSLEARTGRRVEYQDEEARKSGKG